MLIEFRRPLLALGALLGANVWAVQSCELNCESVSRANGHTTAGKSGVMRCTIESGQVRRLDQTLRDGKTVGPVLMVLADGERREYSLNELHSAAVQVCTFAASYTEYGIGDAYRAAPAGAPAPRGKKGDKEDPTLPLGGDKKDPPADETK